MSAVEEVTPYSDRKGFGGTFRLILCVPVLFLYFVIMTLALKTVFIVTNWAYLRSEEWGSISRALLLGLRFDAAILSYLFFPAVVLYCIMILGRWTLLRRILEGYFVTAAFFIQILWFADLQYFEEAGKHFTYEAFVYLGASLLPILSGAFKLHPWLSSLSILSGIGFSVMTVRFTRRCLNAFAVAPVRMPHIMFTVILLLAMDLLGTRGGMIFHPLKIGNSCISANPYLNGLCLNPVYSTFKTVFTSKKRIHFYSDSFNVGTVRALLGMGGQEPTSADYPFWRVSPGTEKGNRKNIVIFILESWTGKNVGCLGSKQGLTPFFDHLSSEGMLFTNFFATGLRTPEGVFSILCSFPNQPLMPIMKRSEVYQTRWRSLSRILDEAGYYNIFIHGRDLDFDRMKHFLKYIHFHKIIDRHDFPPSKSGISDSWPGYDDEEVMRRAVEEFSKQKGRPFFGVIYTMNTHEPFVTPEGFPQAFPPTSASNKFFNSLRYSDHTIETFFDLVKTKPWFKDTIFLFVADHTRTGDACNFFDQHHIPMLIYSPGYVQHALNPVVGSQVDILPTVLGLLQLKTSHASWGRNLLEVTKDQGFAVSVAGNEVRWHDGHYLLNDSLGDGPAFLFDILKDRLCSTDVWEQRKEVGKALKTKVRSYVSLGQTLLYENRVCPVMESKK